MSGNPQLEAALHHHLNHNLFPPMPQFFGAALAVITHQEDEEGYVVPVGEAVREERLAV